MCTLIITLSEQAIEEMVRKASRRLPQGSAHPATAPGIPSLQLRGAGSPSVLVSLQSAEGQTTSAEAALRIGRARGRWQLFLEGWRPSLSSAGRPGGEAVAALLGAIGPITLFQLEEQQELAPGILQRVTDLRCWVLPCNQEAQALERGQHLILCLSCA